MQLRSSNIRSRYLSVFVCIRIVDCALGFCSCCRSFPISQASFVYDASAALASLMFGHVPDADALVAPLAVHLLDSPVLVLLQLQSRALFWMDPHHVLHHVVVLRELLVALAISAVVGLMAVFATSQIYPASPLPLSFFFYINQACTTILMQACSTIMIQACTALCSCSRFVYRCVRSSIFVSSTKMDGLDELAGFYDCSCFRRLLLPIPISEAQNLCSFLWHSG